MTADRTTTARPDAASDTTAAEEPHISIERATVEDAGEILTVQRAAFVSEAIIYGTADMPPLTQTLEQLRAELSTEKAWVARAGTRVVGAIRAQDTADLLLIGRIAVAPDMQGLRIGRDLLAAAEQDSDAPEAELFTGSLSEANLRLYEKCGYRVTQRIDQADGTQQIFLRKPLREGAASPTQRADEAAP